MTNLMCNIIIICKYIIIVEPFFRRHKPLHQSVVLVVKHPISTFVETEKKTAIQYTVCTVGRADT